MRAGHWGDLAIPPGHIPDQVVLDWLTRSPVTLAQHEATKREIAAGWQLKPGVEVVGPPHLIRAMQDMKPLPWKWIGFGALVALMAWWTLSA
ncbi:MAG: hypothetical protein [Bacteriophage sp.]|nr:MAG: hypothetical protein [Bacteriophage sp.]